ncbi:MAG: YebC/PmpR family DNA-binding transcriptional regulator [Chloroflexi bacterium]|nr:YebC/PmpR family DNA-binding transcriptional regulator [Chloroflexota bacterium]
MSGHSKWSQIKRKKGVIDAKRGQIFTKMAREIMIATRAGGSGDPAANFRLRLAIQRAKDVNMPADNIERAIKKGSGEGQADAMAEISYEGYAPGGAAIFVEAMTDNKNRTASEVRRVFTRHGGNLGESGSVAWLFQNTGVVAADSPPGKAEDIALAAIDAGADDVKTDGDSLEVYVAPQQLENVRKAIERAGAKISTAELQMVPKTTIPVEGGTAMQALHLLEGLDELDDVQKVYTNAEFPQAVLAQA